MALITTIGGIIVAILLHIFYNFLLAKVEGIVSDMEEASIDLEDSIIRYKSK